VASSSGPDGREPLSGAGLSADLLAGSHLYTSVEVVGQTGSTNADLLAAARSGAAGGAVLIAEEQTAGRGRLDRSWHSSRGAALTFSVLLRPAGIPPARISWLPLLTGVAVAAALRQRSGLDVSLKWPNDVLATQDVPGRPGKLAGILAEQAGDAVVVGIGLNVTTAASELPVPTATSLALAGAPGQDRAEVLITILRELELWYLRWAGTAEPGDAAASGLRAEYLRCCSTIGRDVRVELPGAAALTGRACDVDGLGRLLVAAPDGVRAVSAGDVVHVR